MKIQRDVANSVLMLPFPIMTKGLLDAFKTEMASVTALWSAKLTGGGGQQDTTLEKKHTSSNVHTAETTEFLKLK